ncbi:hypothetical protein IAT38_001961 [Cryptococcus sp. DSM 104549]
MRPPPLPLPKQGSSSDSVPKSGGASMRVLNVKNEKEKTGRQSFSCAECRRLKLKCSREWPCTSCEKRGCAQICPNGEMRTGKGKRLILADTAELHQRISLLEVALAQAHGKSSSTPHPLLESPYLFSPREGTSTRPYARPGGKDGNDAPRPGEDDLLQGAFGTLTIGQEGQATFVGSFAGSEYLREGEDSGDEIDARLQTPLPGAGISNAGMATPPATAAGGQWTGDDRDGDELDAGLGLHSSLFAGGDVQFDLEALRKELPDYDREGRALVESYWENVNWQYQVIPRTMFENDHVLNAYDTASPANAHKLACVFLVMALGAMFDLNRPPFHPRGEQLFLFGRACISTLGIEHASPATVQAMHLMGSYILNDKRGNGAEVFWPILGTAIKIAQSLGLHRDGSHFGLSEYEIEERRQVWWEVVTYDRLQALCFGRPCSTSYKWSDTKMPEVSELIGDEDGFHRAKYGLMHLMERVIDIQTQTAAVSYAAVAQLDLDLREYKKNLPDLLLPNVPIQDLPLERNVHPHLVIHRFGIRLQIAQMRLLLNRPLFARALKDFPGDPSHSKLGTSFVALFESAQEIVQLVKALVIYHPSLVARWWFFWFHAFSSAVCLAAIAIRAPTCAFASPSFHGMSIVCDISAAAREGCRAKKGLPILLRLRKRAHEALVAASRSKKSKTTGEGSGEEDDLSHLVGSAKLRRVQAHARRRSASIPGVGSGSGGSGQMAGGVGAGGMDGTPSPGSGGSVATSATLAEAGFYEGIVPPFPREQGSSASTTGGASSYGHQPLRAPAAWMGDDQMADYGEGSGSGNVGNGVNGFEMGQAQGQHHGPSNSIGGAPPAPWMYMQEYNSSGQEVSPSTVELGTSQGAGTSPAYDSSMVDMDMSMALGMGMMGGGIGMGMMGAGAGGSGSGDAGMPQHDGAGESHQGQGHGPAGVFSPENEIFGFDFEAFVNTMGSG